MPTAQDRFLQKILRHQLTPLALKGKNCATALRPIFGLTLLIGRANRQVGIAIPVKIGAGKRLAKVGARLGRGKGLRRSNVPAQPIPFPLPKINGAGNGADDVLCRGNIRCADRQISHPIARKVAHGQCCAKAVSADGSILIGRGEDAPWLRPAAWITLKEEDLPDDARRRLVSRPITWRTHG